MNLALSPRLIAATLLASSLLAAQTPAPAKPAAPAPKPAAPKAAAPAKPATAPKPPAAAKPKAAPAKPTSTVAPQTDDEKIIYALGLSMFRALNSFDLSPAEVELVRQAVADAAAKKPALNLEEWGPKIQGLAMARAQRVSEQAKALGVAYAAKVAAEPGAVKTDSGLVYRELTPGTGASPVASDTVKVNYRGTLIDGTEFDSSYKRNEPAQFPLNGVIKCWTEGVQKMKTGGKSQLVCPADLAYGDRGQGPIPAGSTLIFEIELLEIAAKQ